MDNDEIGEGMKSVRVKVRAQYVSVNGEYTLIVVTNDTRYREC